jgi:hypothetical protein
MALAYDYIKTGEYTYRLVHKDTQEPYNMGKDLCDRYDSGEFAWTVEKKKK